MSETFPPAVALELRRLSGLVEQLLARLAPPLPAPQQRLIDALRGEFSDGPFTSREVMSAARSPLKIHDPLRAALAELKLTDAHKVGMALHALPGATRHKRERGAAVWSIAGPGPA